MPNPPRTPAPQLRMRTDFAHLIDGELVSGKEWFDVIKSGHRARPSPARRC